VLSLTGKNLTEEPRAMLDLINRSLTLYKIERGAYQLQPEAFDLCSTPSGKCCGRRPNAGR
jgi:hypothetical protein